VRVPRLLEVGERLFPGVAPVLGEYDGELLAPVPGDGQRVRQLVAQQLGECLQDGVTVVVAEGVVDRLEVVEVDHEQPAAGGQRIEGLPQCPAVVEPGEGVGAGEVAQRGGRDAPAQDLRAEGDETG
jgi:hypothetical protein